MDTIRWFTRKTAVHSWRAVATAMAALAAAAVVIPVASSSAVAARPAAPPVPVLRWHPCDGTFPCVTASRAHAGPRGPSPEPRESDTLMDRTITMSHPPVPAWGT